jgi:hypothetical protein
MGTQPASLDDHPAGIGVSVKQPAGVAHRIGAWIPQRVRGKSVPREGRSQIVREIARRIAREREVRETLD